MKNLHLKNLDIEKLLNKTKHNDLLTDEKDENNKYDDDDLNLYWTKKVDKKLKKTIRREELMIILMLSIPSIFLYIMLVTLIQFAR